MPIIDVRDLRKASSVMRKQCGLRGTFRPAARPDLQRVGAVKGVPFSLEPSERLAFIDPNG